MPTNPPSSATQQKSLPASGGSVSITLGSQTATVTVPAGALAGPATLTLKLYLASALPVTFSKARKAESLPTGATPIVGLVVDDGGVALNAPLQVSFAAPAAPPSSASIMLSGYDNGASADVDAMTYASGLYSTTSSPSYPGMTLASQTPYLVYSVATANVATPTATVTVAGPATLGTASQGTYTATEATANGFPFLNHTFTYAVSSATLGTMTTAGVLTGGGIGGTGNVVATDAAVSTFTGSLAVAVTSFRPGAAGLTEQYTGTQSEVDANYAINPSPGPTSTPVSFSQTAQATVNVAAAQATDGSGNVIFTANESDAASLETTTASTVSTVAYQTQTSGSVNVQALNTIATESSGVVYEHNYVPTSGKPTNGLLTVLPEVPGSFANTALETYTETDPGVNVNGSGATTVRNVNADGSYSATINELVPDSAVENSDFSGSLNLNSFLVGEADVPLSITFSAPAAGNITITFNDPNYSALSGAFLTPNWIPAQATPSIETDTVTAASTLDPSCSPSSSFTGAAMLTTQQLQIVDIVNGTYETRTTKSYDVNGVGTLCTVVSDTIQTFYDYSGQEGPFVLYSAPTPPTPVISTTINETLSLKTSNVAQVAAVKRSTQALPTTQAFALLPRSIIADRVQHLARTRQAARIAAFRKNSSNTVLRGGLGK